MPKTKKRGKGGGGKDEKERPLLTVQGVLRLEKSFVTARHEDADVMKVKKSDAEKAEEIKLIPGHSEHDLVDYKAGYDIGPSNPFPTNEPEAKIFEEQRKAEARTEAFEELKKASEADKQKFRQENLIPENELKPPGDENDDDGGGNVSDKDKSKSAAADPKQLDPDNPENYFLPQDLTDEPGFHNDKPLDFRTPVGKIRSQPFDPKSIDFFFQTESAEASPKVVEAVDAGDESSQEPMEVEPPSQIEVEMEDSNSQQESHLGPSQMKPLPDEQNFGKDMALSVALEMEEKRRTMPKTTTTTTETPPEESFDDEAVVYSLDELEQMKAREESELKNMATNVQGPKITEQQLSQVQKEKDDYDAKRLLDAYWQFVKENPGDFNGWTYLLQHVESVDILDEIRSAYNEFLPLYPYCYAYWIRYSDTEVKHEHWQRALAILHRGLEAIPLSVDLWVSYLNLYHKMYKTTEDFDNLFREQCQRAILTAGLDFKSDVLWEHYIDYELERKNFKHITEIFAKLVAVPTKLFNKHWDNLIAHVRDHHPRDILDYENYDKLRKITCQELGLTYRPDPVIEPSSVREVVLPEDKLKAGMKERIVASLVLDHEATEEAVDQRLRFEEKIKRPYFHVRPMDLKQLKNWDSYLDFEIKQGNHERIVVLFERCLIPCAKYEQFWAKYATYMESHHKSNSASAKKSDQVQDDKEEDRSVLLRKAKWSFGTGLTNVEDIRKRRCMWTLRGWKETDKEGNEIMVAEEIPEQKESKESDSKAPEKTSEEKEIDDEMASVCKTTWSGQEGQEAVRNVYKRACFVHCPNRAMIHLKFAAFEEEVGNLDGAREVLNKILAKYPLLIEASMQLIDIERRSGNTDKAVDLYRKLMKRIPANRKSIRTWVAMKLSRFQFKVCNEPDKALTTLRSALKKDRGDPRLYSQIIDICYQRTPVDIQGVTAAIELALLSTDLNSMQKLAFVKRKVEFMQEFGDVARYREANDQIKTYKALCAVDLKAEAKKRKELEREEARLKELEEIKAKTKAMANLKGKLAESEGRLMCTQCQAAMYPNAEGVYEFENFVPGVQNNASTAFGRPEKAANVANNADNADNIDDDGIIDLLDMEIPEEQEEAIKKTLEEKTKYKEVAPTWELNIETYGYGKRRKVYDPDYEHVESAKFKEYERLEGEGYDESLKDKDHDKLKNIHAPGLGSNPNPKTKKVNVAKMKKYDESAAASSSAKFTTSDYIVPPKVPQLQLGPGIGPVRPGGGDGGDGDAPIHDNQIFELPPELANPQKAPCVNVPEWFVKEGGELCLSDTKNGLSTIRYWPKFLSEKGNALMFKRLRKYCKWHQKQVLTNQNIYENLF